MKPAAIILPLFGIGLVFGTALTASLLVPYRLRIGGPPPGLQTRNIWGQVLSQEPAEDLFFRINHEVHGCEIKGVQVQYHLEFLGLDMAGNSLHAKFTMRILGTTPAAVGVSGDGIATYFKRVNMLLNPKSIMLNSGYGSDSPTIDKARDIVEWTEHLWIINYR